TAGNLLAAFASHLWGAMRGNPIIVCKQRFSTANGRLGNRVDFRSDWGLEVPRAPQSKTKFWPILSLTSSSHDTEETVLFLVLLLCGVFATLNWLLFA